MHRRLLCALAVAASGCGVGAGEAVDGTQLLVTRDFGTQVLLDERDPQTAGTDTVLRLLERNADRVEKRFGGGFVQSVEGVAGGIRDGRQVDWFFYVDGRLSPEGAAAVRVREGNRIWWDHHEWEDAQPAAVVGSFPAPFLRQGARVECVPAGVPACSQVRDALAEAGAASGGRGPVRVVVGPWRAIRDRPGVRVLEGGLEASGVFARPAADGRSIELLDGRGGVTRRLAAGTGLVAATASEGRPPVWIVTGTDDEGVAAAAGRLRTDDLEGRYAIATSGSGAVRLPED